jgi:hypothetical protein
VEAPATGPTCTITTEKELYSFGDKLRIMWTSERAVRVTFVSGRAAVAEIPLAGTFAPQGETTVTANISGTPLITLVAYAEDGASATCTKTITVSR